ncbi:MAG: phage tail family protein [Solobacterium sp.]|jgi:phage-related protein|nr:phage tail family protein [Solobacterium sp.]
MTRTIKCTNENNVSITLGEEFNQWLLTEASGMFSFDNDVAVTDNTMTDGSTYLGTTTKKRNIVLTLRDKSDHKENRQSLYTIFKPKGIGTLIYTEGDEERTIDYYVESVNIDGANESAMATISLICPDPFFKDLYDIDIQMAGWQSEFEWIHEFIDGGEEFGTRIKSSLKEIDNDSAADYIGITATITVDGSVTNPSLLLVEQDQKLQIGTTANPMNLVVGDIITITTDTNKKNVYLTHNGVKTAINEYLSDDSQFMQLVHGSNTFKYDADSGADNMNVTISYRLHYVGV